ncbi:MAG TPA: HEAT repeat domain-containing protein [Myxococcota bacterium]|nr:HEAT repeat domain-containing protein [Myxococcota bacterium]
MSAEKAGTPGARWPRFERMGLAALGLGLALALAPGCGGSGSTCAVWTEKLASSGEIEKALGKIGDLKCKEAGPVLKQLFDDGLLQDAILDVLIKIDDGPTALPILRSAIVLPKTSRQAATLAKDWKLADTRAELVRVLSEEPFIEARDAAFDTLLSFDPASQHEDLMIALALTDPNRQLIDINRRAIEELGKMGSKKAIPTLVKALFLRSQKGNDAYSHARFALARVGDQTVVDALIALLEGKNPELVEFALSNGFEPWEITSTPKVVQVLSDALDPKATDALVADMAAEIVPPEVDDRTFARWARDKSDRFLLTSFAFAYMGPDTAVGPLGAIFRDPKKDVMRQRVNAARALSMIGSEAAQDVLIRAWNDELVVEVLKAGTLEIVALAVDDRRLAEWDRMLGVLGPDDPKPKQPLELSESVKQVLDESEHIRSYIGVVRECKGELACYLGKLKSEIQHEQVKAIAVLSRGRFGATPEIKAALLEAFDKAEKSHIDTRRYALMGLTRLGNQQDGDLLITRGQALLEAGDNFWGGELFALGHGMKRRMLQ